MKTNKTDLLICKVVDCLNYVYKEGYCKYCYDHIYLHKRNRDRIKQIEEITLLRF